MMSFNKYLCVKKWAGVFLVFGIVANAEINKQSSYRQINTETSVVKLLIDDFSSDSRNSAFGTKWSFMTDRAMDSIYTGRMEFVEHDSRRCLHMVRSALHKSKGGLLQARLNLHHKAKYFDAHRFEGVQLQVKGNGQKYAIHLRTTDTRLPWQFYQAQFSTNGGWQGIKIPFRRFRPYYLSEPLDITKLKSLAIVAIKKESNADIFVDEIAFYKDQIMYKKLTPQEEWVIVCKGTEQPFSGKYNNHFEKGVYTCKRCGDGLFESSSKFRSSCGWPSFDDRLERAVEWQSDADGIRTEIVCAKCGAHLGHVFLGEGFTPQNTRYCVNSVSLDFVPAQGPRTERAIFASGCFWGTEYHLQRAAGVISTTVGYTGGNVEDPNYKQVCTGKTGHAEAVEVIYDPSKTNYEKLAKLFFETHDFTQSNRQGPDIGTQYRSAIFYLNEQQRMTAIRLVELLNHKGYNVKTEITPAKKFWQAEGYHQDYYERNGKMPYCHIYRKIF